MGAFDHFLIKISYNNIYEYIDIYPVCPQIFKVIFGEKFGKICLSIQFNIIIPNSQIVFSNIWVKFDYQCFLKIEIYINCLSFTKTPSIVIICIVKHNFLRELLNSDKIFGEYESPDMVIDENDEQTAQGNKVMYFVYSTMYGVILVSLKSKLPNFSSVMDTTCYLLQRRSN